MAERIICDSYFKKDKQIIGSDPTKEYNKRILAVNNMYGWLYKQGILEKVSFEFKDMTNSVCFAFDAKDLEPYRNEMKKSGVEEADLAVKHIFDMPCTPCMYSGAIELGWTMHTYRDVDGCVGSSWECGMIQSLNTEAIYEVNAVKEAHGTKEAVKALFGYFTFPEKKTTLDAAIDSAKTRADNQDTPVDLKSLEQKYADFYLIDEFAGYSTQDLNIDLAGCINEMLNPETANTIAKFTLQHLNHFVSYCAQENDTKAMQNMEQLLSDLNASFGEAMEPELQGYINKISATGLSCYLNAEKSHDIGPSR